MRIRIEQSVVQVHVHSTVADFAVARASIEVTAAEVLNAASETAVLNPVIVPNASTDATFVVALMTTNVRRYSSPIYGLAKNS